MSIRRTLNLLVVGPLLLAGTACSDDLTTPSATEVSVVITDAPGNVVNFWIDVSRGFLVDDAEEEVDLFSSSPGPINVASLTDGETVTLAANTITPSGTYLDLVLQLDGAVLETEDGEVLSFGGMAHPEGVATTGTLECTGCEDAEDRDGNAVKVVETIVPRVGGSGIGLAGGGVILVLDFDLAQSLIPPPAGGGSWTLDPVIPVASAAEAFQVLGEVTLDDGVTIPDCPAGTPRDLSSFIPAATSQTFNDAEGVDIRRTGNTTDDGAFSIAFLQSDIYDLGFESRVVVSSDRELTFDAQPTPGRVEPVAGQAQLEAAYTVLSVTCDPRS